MAEFQVVVFAADNIDNPNSPGTLPIEDGTFLSDLSTGDQITWLGGGENALVTIVDNRDTVFDEARSDQTLRDEVEFDGATFNPGQVVTPTYTIIFDGSDGETYVMTSFNFSPNTNNQEPDAVFWEGSIPPKGTVLTVVNEINPTGGSSRPYADFVTCFCRGTHIATPEGERPVEDLARGDLVRTAQGKAEPIVLISRRTISSKELAKAPGLRPVRITAGALGDGLPRRDLLVSPQHRLQVSSPIAARMFGTEHVLVAAFRLTNLSGIYVDTKLEELTYVHILLRHHDVIFAEGTPSESLFLGKQTLASMPPDARRELFAILPQLAPSALAPEPACLIPSGKQQNTLVARHTKNQKPILT